MQSQNKNSQLWSIILADGDGKGTKRLIRRWLGYQKPKQFCAFVGTRSMLQHTLDRADRLVQPGQRVTVVAREYLDQARDQLEKRPPGILLPQPSNRGTAAGLLLPLCHICSCDPYATVVIFPSDHFVYPEDLFLEAVQRAVAIAELMTDRLVLLGVQPKGLELDHGWILPATEMGWIGHYRIAGVKALVEGSHLAETRRAMGGGGLWNTLVLAGKAYLLWEMSWRCLPDLMKLFRRYADAIGSSRESEVREDVYRQLPASIFSSHVLSRVTDRVSVVEINDVLWSDWGRPERIAATLDLIGRKPEFPEECLLERSVEHLEHHQIRRSGIRAL